MKEIGGFFELELQKGLEFHSNAIKLNTGRNCLEYIIKVRKYKRIFLPRYICDVVLEPIKKFKLKYEFYSLNNQLDPVFERDLRKDEAFLYVNYFGLKQDTVLSLSKKIANLIIDNTQAFYAEPLIGIDTFYSPRKFFGVPDGGYLFTKERLEEDFQKDQSWDRIDHLVKRIDLNAQITYPDFKKNSDSLKGLDIYYMSEFTKSLLDSINYDYVCKKRNCNFHYIHERLKQYNLLSSPINNIKGPMVYPFLIKKDGIKERLIKNKIYVATYWPNVFEWCQRNTIEYTLAKYLIPLPVDQRYCQKDMERIIKVLGV